MGQPCPPTHLLNSLWSYSGLNHFTETALAMVASDFLFIYLAALGLARSIFCYDAWASLWLCPMGLGVWGSAVEAEHVDFQLLDQGLNPHPLHWKADSYLLDHQEILPVTC